MPAQLALETPYNRSFALIPDTVRGGVLLVHGLTDSPYSMRAEAEIFRDQGFYVQVLRLPGQGGKGFHGGRDGDVYLNISLRPHRLYRASGDDLFLDLPVTPWEAALGADAAIPTPAGVVKLKVTAGTRGGQQLRLAGRGLPTPQGRAGDLYAIVQIVLPPEPTERERSLSGSPAKTVHRTAQLDSAPPGA